MENNNLQLFLENTDRTITKDKIIKNPNYLKIWEYVLNNKGSIENLFYGGYQLSKKDKNQASMFFLLLSLVPNLTKKHRNLAVEAHLLVGGVEREDYTSITEIIALV